MKSRKNSQSSQKIASRPQFARVIALPFTVQDFVFDNQVKIFPEHQIGHVNDIKYRSLQIHINIFNNINLQFHSFGFAKTCCHEMAELADFVLTTIKKSPESQLSIALIYSHANSSSYRANEVKPTFTDFSFYNL